MKQEEQIQLLLKGVDYWNQYRNATEFKPDFSGTNLYERFGKAGKLDDDLRVQLSGVNLSHTNLSHTALANAVLVNADLRCADLSYAVLPGAILTNSDLSYANFAGANIIDVDFAGAKLTEASFTDVMRNVEDIRNDAFGVKRVGGSRIPLDTVVVAFTQGATVMQIAEQYPSLSPSDIYSAIGYYLEHQAEVDEYLSIRADKSREIKAEIESQGDLAGLRERMIQHSRGGT